MEANLTRAIAGAAVLVVLAVGGSFVGGLTDSQAADAQALLDREITPDQAREEALAKPAGYTQTPAFYETEVESTAKALSLSTPVDQLMGQLRQPNEFLHPITPGAPVIMSAGETRHEGGLEITIVHEELRTKRNGMETTNQHTLLHLSNVGSSPLAYHLRVRRSDGEECKVRAITQYDALVLDPGSQARISVCPGSQSVEIHDLRVLVLDPLEARWVRQLPPRAVGLDDVAVRSHKSDPPVASCTDLPAEETSRQLAVTTTAPPTVPPQWEDVVDFYARHDCRHWRWPLEYRRATNPIEVLPLPGTAVENL